MFLIKNFEKHSQNEWGRGKLLSILSTALFVSKDTWKMSTRSWKQCCSASPHGMLSIAEKCVPKTMCCSSELTSNYWWITIFISLTFVHLNIGFGNYHTWSLSGLRDTALHLSSSLVFTLYFLALYKISYSLYYVL